MAIAQSSPRAAVRSAAAGLDALAAYLHEIGTTALLTAEEEVHLAQLIERGRAAAGRPRSPDESSAHVVLAGRMAAERLAAANLRLVASVARRHMHHGMALGDLIQEGNIGLLRAVESFDWHRGFRFSTYATWWIRQAVQRGIDNQGRTIRLPTGMRALVARAARARADLHRDLEREPTDAEVGAVVDLSAERVRALRAASAPTVSYDRPTSEEGAGSLADLLPDAHAADGAATAVDTSDRQDVAALLEALTPREQEVVARRFGLGDGAALTLAELAVHMGITRERVRQIEAGALRKLRRAAQRQGLLNT